MSRQGDTVTVHRLRCSCGFVISATTEDRKFAYMLEHVLYVHTRPIPSE